MQKKPTLQAFLSKPLAAALNLDLTLAIVNGNSPSLQPNSMNMKAPTNAASMQFIQK